MEERYMKLKKAIAYVIGGTGVLAALVGLALLPASKAVTISTAVTVICLSLAFGILIPNPICFVGLIAGICALIFPSWIVGVILIVMGAAIAIVNLFLAKKYLK